MMIRAIAKIVKAHKRDKAMHCFFKPTGTVVYDQRIMSIMGLDTASPPDCAGAFVYSHADGRLPARAVASHQRPGRFGVGQ